MWGKKSYSYGISSWWVWIWFFYPSLLPQIGTWWGVTYLWYIIYSSIYPMLSCFHLFNLSNSLCRTMSVGVSTVPWHHTGAKSWISEALLLSWYSIIQSLAKITNTFLWYNGVYSSKCQYKVWDIYALDPFIIILYFQASPRGGVLEEKSHRVLIRGEGVTVMLGTLLV